MDIKKIRKATGRFFGWFGLGFCSLIVKLTPARYLYSVARGFAFLGFRIAKRQRKIALDSLAVAFGTDKTPAELTKIAEDCFQDMSKSAIELLFLMDRPELLKKRVALSGVKNLAEGLKRGKGVILVSAHFGNFPLLMAKLSLEGYSVGGIMRPMRDERVERIFEKKRRRLGVKTIYSQPRDACVNATIQSLRSNELVFIPIDQNFGTAGVFVRFFGSQAATATGPVVFAQRTDAALIPCFIVRQKDDTHTIVFEPVIELAKTGDPKEVIQVNIQRLTDIIEAYIRKYPAQWGWIHRRWKSKPGQSK
jgi:Kdo2-lipid IVA lauroyltransferase/acyltransferase